MQKYTTVNSIISILDELYPDAHCTLDYETPFQLLIATILSAQTTDKKVNEITPILFCRFPTAKELASADQLAVMNILQPIGFQRVKAKNIIRCAQKLIGKPIPDSIDELTKLDGVGRKTANLILGEVHSKPAIVADTHVMRISQRLGLTEYTAPHRIELDLKDKIQEDMQLRFCHLIVAFGRDICQSRNPKCEVCRLRQYCKVHGELER